MSNKVKKRRKNHKLVVNTPKAQRNLILDTIHRSMRVVCGLKFRSRIQAAWWVLWGNHQKLYNTLLK